jgi:hypothetical protein
MSGADFITYASTPAGKVAPLPAGNGAGSRKNCQQTIFSNAQVASAAQLSL